MKTIRDTEGRTYAIQLGRLVVYLTRPRYARSWSPAGIMVWHRGERLHAKHFGWRICYAARTPTQTDERGDE